MHSSTLKALVATLAFGAIHALPQPIPRADAPTDTSEVIAGLKTDPTRIKRFQRLLTDAGEQLLSGEELAKASIYDFNNGPPVGAGTNGGTVAGANVETFPILLDSGLTTNFATLGPCGVFVPHVHPRANEFFTVIEGEVDFGYMLEIGLLKSNMSPEVNGKLTKYKGTLFPQGSIHYQINNNPECKPATIIATLSSDDAGATPVLLQSGPDGKAKRQIGMNDVEDFFPLLPPELVNAAKECLTRCSK